MSIISGVIKGPPVLGGLESKGTYLGIFGGMKGTDIKGVSVRVSAAVTALFPVKFSVVVFPPTDVSESTVSCTLSP